MIDDIGGLAKQRKNHFKVLDSWRGVSASMVVLLHFMGNSHFYQIPVIRSAGFFVDFFFVLSGFVIFANYKDRLIEGFGFFKFMIIRFGRLYPLHFVLLLAFVSIEILQIIIPQLQGFSKFPPFHNIAETPWDAVSQLFLFHALDLQQAKGFNAPSWSISAEFYTYAVFAAALIFLKKRIDVFCWLLFFIMPAILVYIYTVKTDYLFIEGFFRCLSGFSAGGLCWMFWNKYHEKILSLKLSQGLWHVFEVIVVVSAYWMIDHTAATPYKYLCVLLFSAGILIFSFEKGFISRILSTKFCMLLGLLSYSIYMNHVFIASKIFPLAGKMIEEKLGYDLFITVDGKDRLGLTLWQGDVISIIYLALVIGVSYITFKIIEDPFRKLFRKFAKH